MEFRTKNYQHEVTSSCDQLAFANSQFCTFLALNNCRHYVLKPFHRNLKKTAGIKTIKPAEFHALTAAYYMYHKDLINMFTDTLNKLQTDLEFLSIILSLHCRTFLC